MKINFFYILFAVFILIVQKMIFADGLLQVSGQYTVLIFLYPLIILALPITFDRPLSLVIAFFIGLMVDMLNDTLGMNAFALVFMTYIRSPIIQLLEPRQGFKSESTSLRSYGFGRAIAYLSVMLGIHILAYFSIDFFTLVLFKRIVFSTILSLAISLPFAYLLLMLLKPK
jgi:rod shape-determining protein MreD